MKEFIIGKNDKGLRLDRFVSKVAPSLPSGLRQKYIRKKRVKLNGKGVLPATRLSEGDCVSLYINDDYFTAHGQNQSFSNIKEPELRIVYEDENLLLADKKPGMTAHGSGKAGEDTLIDNIKAYLFLKGQWLPGEESTFTPSLCNRIDRNTGGIVIAAKNAEALRIMNEKIRNRQVSRFYLCLVLGKPAPAEGSLKGYLLKDGPKNQVVVSEHSLPESKAALTLYKTLKSSGSLSLVECRLISGRSHQIRAQLAGFGHPILGDMKYGNPEANRRYGRKYQALYSYKLRFDFSDDSGRLSYLKGLEFTVDDIDFVNRFFP